MQNMLGLSVAASFWLQGHKAPLSQHMCYNTSTVYTAYLNNVCRIFTFDVTFELTYP